jgi:hypothetical protein
MLFAYMANIYEFEVSRDIVEQLAKDLCLSLITGSAGNIVDNLLCILDQPSVFQKVKMDEKPGYCIRVGQIATERFTGQGLHMFTHSGSEGFLDTLEFDRRLKLSLERNGIPFKDRTIPEK